MEIIIFIIVVLVISAFSWGSGGGGGFFGGCSSGGGGCGGGGEFAAHSDAIAAIGGAQPAGVNGSHRAGVSVRSCERLWTPAE